MQLSLPCCGMQQTSVPWHADEPHVMLGPGGSCVHTSLQVASQLVHESGPEPEQMQLCTFVASEGQVRNPVSSIHTLSPNASTHGVVLPMMTLQPTPRKHISPGAHVPHG